MWYSFWIIQRKKEEKRKEKEKQVEEILNRLRFLKLKKKISTIIKIATDKTFRESSVASKFQAREAEEDVGEGEREEEGEGEGYEEEEEEGEGGEAGGGKKQQQLKR